MSEDKDKSEPELITKDMLENLTQRERKILKESFGIDLEVKLTTEALKKRLFP
ncbi:MAG: hypothetical protein V3W04_07580 [Gammaproteobacteria bacterium]